MNYLNLYVDFLKKFVNLKRPLKVVFDCSSGTAGLILKKLFNNHQLINYKLINQKPDGNFPNHSPNPLEKGAMNQLQKNVIKEKADLGIVFDADADRAFFIDHQGRTMPVYVIPYLLSLYEKPPFVTDLWVYKLLKTAGLLDAQKFFVSRIGTYFIKKAMKEKKANFGGEYSGHYYFKDSFSSDDGILAAIKVINIVSQLPYSLADFYNLLPKIYTEQFNLKTDNQAGLIKKIEKQWLKKGVKIEKIDGITFDYGRFWFNTRPSNTEPLVRFFVASTDKNKLKEVVEKINASDID